jgi:hypothetical protein
MKLILFLFLTFYIGFSFSQKDTVNNDWLKKDISIIQNLIFAVKNNEWNYKVFSEKLNIINPKFSSDIVEDYLKIENEIYNGGHISFWSNICILEGEIFYFSAELDESEYDILDSVTKLDSSIQIFIKDNFLCHKINKNETFYSFEYLNSSLFELFKSRINSKLGSLQDVKIDTAAQKYYDLLMNPFEKLTVGNRCGAFGRNPKGRYAIEYIKNNNSELLMNILKGYNPEGRIYAVAAIKDLSKHRKIKLQKIEKETIKKIINLDIPIRSCNGCLIGTSKAKKLVKKMSFKRLLKINNKF